MVDPNDPLRCVHCGEQVDASGPGIYQSPDGETWSWVAFVEDWRGGYFDILHPRCLAKAHGVDALIDAVHRRDLIDRPTFDPGLPMTGGRPPVLRPSSGGPSPGQP